MSKLFIPTGALPPAFTAKERATVDAYFGRRASPRHQRAAMMRLMMPLAAMLVVVSAALTIG